MFAHTLSVHAYVHVYINMCKQLCVHICRLVCRCMWHACVCVCVCTRMHFIPDTSTVRVRYTQSWRTDLFCSSLVSDELVNRLENDPTHLGSTTADLLLNTLWHLQATGPCLRGDERGRRGEERGGEGRRGEERGVREGRRRGTGENRGKRGKEKKGGWRGRERREGGKRGREEGGGKEKRRIEWGGRKGKHEGKREKGEKNKRVKGEGGKIIRTYSRTFDLELTITIAQHVKYITAQELQ